MSTNSVVANRQQPRDFPALLEASKPEIAKMLPEGMSVERVCRVALTAFRMTPEIQECTPISILSAVMKACELGLEPGGALKQAWLVPYKGQCSFQVSYFGLLELARRSGELATADARLVRENDVFELSYNPRPVFFHRPNHFNLGEITLVYAYAVLKNDEIAFEVMCTAEVEDIRKKSKAGPVWNWYWGEMARKTVLKRLLKKQRLSVQLAEAIDLDNEAEAGRGEVVMVAPGRSHASALAESMRGRAAELPAPAEGDGAEVMGEEPAEREPGEDG